MRRLPLRSPLRMRGKGPDDRAHPLVPGITPACAGKRKPHLHKKGCTWDHPRVCGEKLVRLMCCRCLAGSPPRMRGKAPRIREDLERMGITPAYAGKRDLVISESGDIEDHPRVCGEKRRVRSWRALLLGSPPRMRGKDGVSGACHSPPGITPAYAGKSVHRSGLHRTEGDHPRVCGEKIYPLLAIASPLGSPPRVRGKVCDLTIIRVHHGITPAYAGKRLKRSHSIGHFSCILCLFHSVLHRASVSGGSRAGPRAPPCLPAQNTVPV